MKKKITFTDRLRDRGLIDQWGFIVFAFIGFVGILLAKYFIVLSHWVAVGACAIMLMYALLIGRAGTGRLRADQAGDNCYYLGLIYTLASLSFAIFTFDPENTATTIVQGFGIALVTTILGLVMRVFFNQGRPDMENIEQQVRLEFMEATSQLKSELSSVVRSLNDMSRELGQSMQEIHTTARTTIEGFATQTTREVLSVTTAATAAIEAQSKEFVTQSERNMTSMDNLVSRFERHGESLDGVTDAHVALAKTARETKVAADATSAAVTSLSQSIDISQSAAQATVDAARAAANQLTADIKLLESGISSIHSEINHQISELRTGPSTDTARSMQLLENAAVSMAARVEQTSLLYDGLSKQVEVALDASKSHNDGLEKELARSREVSLRIHKSFEKMTDSIANFAEGKING